MALRISDLGTAPTVEETDLVEIAEVDGESPSGYSSYKTTILGIANKIATSTVFSGLVTTAKNIVGAINEIVNGFDDNVIDVIKDLKQVRSATITDGIATFDDVLEANSLVEATATFSPKQDLHGQSAPYPAGGGKNKLLTTVSHIKNWNTNGTWSGNIYTVNGGTFTIKTDTDGNVIGITVNGTFNTQTSFIIEYRNNESCPYNGYVLNGCPSGGSGLTYDFGVSDITTGSSKDYGSGVIISLANTGRWNCSIVIRSGYTATNLLFTPMISQNGGDFAPYSNICPISGWDGLNLNVSDGDTEGTDYPATFSDTIMGGIYDFVSGDGGEVWKDYLVNDLSLSYSSSGQYFTSTEISELLAPASSSEKIGGNMCEFLKNHEITSLESGQFAITTSGRIRIKIDGYTTEEDLKTAFGSNKLTLKLATPTPIELTGQEVTALEGVNVVTTDGDGMSSVKYKKMNL